MKTIHDNNTGLNFLFGENKKRGVTIIDPNQKIFIRNVEETSKMAKAILQFAKIVSNSLLKDMNERGKEVKGLEITNIEVGFNYKIYVKKESKVKKQVPKKNKK